MLMPNHKNQKGLDQAIQDLVSQRMDRNQGLPLKVNKKDVLPYILKAYFRQQETTESPSKGSPTKPSYPSES